MTARTEAGPETDDEHDPLFESLLTYLREARGFDFTGYKRASLLRRVRRRMAQLEIEDFEQYQDFLQVHPAEFTTLFNTILINVTGFLRDRESWDFLAHRVVPEVLSARPSGPIRVWSAGCATGEEAYSLAMTLADVLGLDEFRQRVKIYATDIDEEALAQARAGAYTDRELGDLDHDRRQRFFESSGHRHIFRKDLRRSLIFGRNDLLQDAPISHLDLLLCRNTLMYFTSEAQVGILQRMHFALEPHGVLFLGRAEMLLSHGALFAPIELNRRFFRKISSATAPVRMVKPTAPDPSPAAGNDDDIRRVQRAAMRSSPTAQIVVTEAGSLALSNTLADELFNLSPGDAGRPVQDLEISYRPVELRGPLDKARDTREVVSVHDVSWSPPSGGERFFEVQVIPLSDAYEAPLGATVVFNDVTRYRLLPMDFEATNQQLERTSQELQSTNEELETTNQELQSTVEELETTNEELQSTNEELETLNEELQAMNDELHSTNDAVQVRTIEIGRLNHFMAAVLASLQSGVAVVDRDLHISAWNRQAEDLWGLRQEEAVGQHLANLDIGLPLDPIKRVVRSTLDDSGPEHHVLDLAAINRRGRSIQIRVTVSPLHEHRGAIGGAILVMDLQNV